MRTDKKSHTNYRLTHLTVQVNISVLEANTTLWRWPTWTTGGQLQAFLYSTPHRYE